MYVVSGTWFFARDKWMFILDKHQHPGPEVIHDWHLAQNHNQGLMQGSHQGYQQRVIMDRDGFFQPLNEDIDFMNAPFLHGNIGEHEFPVKMESQHSLTAPGPPAMHQQPSVGIGACHSPPSSVDEEAPLQNASFVHSRSDEQINAQGGAPSAFYSGSSLAVPLGASFQGTPSSKNLEHPLPMNGLENLPPLHPYHPMDRSLRGYEQPSNAPWRFLNHGTSSMNTPSTLCPTQLAPQSLPADEAQPGTAQNDLFPSLIKHEHGGVANNTDNQALALEDHSSTTQSSQESDSTQKSSQRARIRKFRKNLRHPLPKTPILPSNDHPKNRISKPKSSRKTRAMAKHNRTLLPLNNPNGTTNTPEITARDEFILTCRAAGMSYRALKEYGNLPDAESTLRGRYRTLTKNKQDRVRRPVWTERDMKLLKEAVEKVERKNNKNKAKIVWSEVVRRMGEAECSYPFGVLSCKRMWEEIRDEKDS